MIDETGGKEVLSEEKQEALERIKFLIEHNGVFKEGEQEELAGMGAKAEGPSATDYWTLAEQLQIITGTDFSNQFDGPMFSGVLKEGGREKLQKATNEVLSEFGTETE